MHDSTQMKLRQEIYFKLTKDYFNLNGDILNLYKLIENKRRHYHNDAF